MLEGEDVPPLLDLSRHRTQTELIQSVSRRKIYRGDGRAETVLIANKTLTVLLDSFAGMLLRREATGQDSELSIHDQAVLSILTRTRQADLPLSRDRAGWVREMMDHIAALTDVAALREARLLIGGLGG
jgi:dGTP triphosphohydrolase